MMTDHSATCPVCAINQAEEQFCGNCGWEFFVVASENNPGLAKYYSARLERHRGLFERLNDAAVKAEETKKEKEQLEAELKTYEEQFGHVWPGTFGEQLPTKSITWELTATRKFRFEAERLKQILPDRLIFLLKTGSRPAANADFEYAVTINTGQAHFINPITAELIVPDGKLPGGKYFLRMISLPQGSYNLLFFHKEQSLRPVFDWNKTIITL